MLLSSEGPPLGNPRLLVMAVLVTLWGSRLTFNFWLKGGFSGARSRDRCGAHASPLTAGSVLAGGEDYRWTEVHAPAPAHACVPTACACADAETASAAQFGARAIWQEYQSPYQQLLIYRRPWPHQDCQCPYQHHRRPFTTHAARLPGSQVVPRPAVRSVQPRLHLLLSAHTHPRLHDPGRRRAAKRPGAVERRGLMCDGPVRAVVGGRGGGGLPAARVPDREVPAQGRARARRRVCARLHRDGPVVVEPVGARRHAAVTVVLCCKVLYWVARCCCSRCAHVART